MDPELEAKENQEFQNSEIGAVEVPGDMKEQMAEQTKEELYELPNKLRIAFDRVVPGLGAEIYGRAQELSGDLLRQLQDSQQRGSASEYGSFNDNTAVSAERESMDFGEINRMVIVLEMVVELVEDQVKRQHSEEKIIDFGQIDADEPRAVPEFWYILTGEREYGSGHEIKVGEYTISSLQDQDADGPGSESRKLVIRKTEKEQQEAGPVAAAEDAKEEIPAADNITYIEDFKRNKPDRRFEENADNSPGEQNRAA